MIAEPLTAMMSCPIDDGAACAIVAQPGRSRGGSSPGRPLVRVDRLRAPDARRYARGHIFIGPVVGPPSMTRDTAREAYEDAGLGPEDVNLAQVHDAFAIEELEYYELLGFCREGEAEKLHRGAADARSAAASRSTPTAA